MSDLVLTELQSQEVGSELWAELAGHHAFWRLVEQGILSVAERARGRTTITAGSYVGLARVGPHIIEIRERVPGTVQALLSWTRLGHRKDDELRSLHGHIGPMIQFVITEFLQELDVYVSRGRELEYVKMTQDAAYIRGHLDVEATIQLRATGRVSLVASRFRQLTGRTSTNRVLLVALQSVEQLARLVHVDAADLGRSRALSILFSDCRDAETVLGPRAAFAHIAAKQRLQCPPDRRRLLASAEVLILGASPELGSRSATSDLPVWFLNTATLWEDAIRVVFRNLLEGGAKVYNGSERPEFVFRDTKRALAQPDLVISAGDLIAVGDAKYKAWGGSASASDTYQLLIHASAYGARSCFLVYPGLQYQLVRLGTASTGASMTLLCARPAELEQDLRRGLHDEPLWPVLQVAAHAGATSVHL